MKQTRQAQQKVNEIFNLMKKQANAHDSNSEELKMALSYAFGFSLAMNLQVGNNLQEGVRSIMEELGYRQGTPNN